MLGELHRKAATRRPVETGEKTFDNTFRDHFEPAELGDLEWVEQVQSGRDRRRCGAAHAAFNRRGVEGWRQSGDVI
jgi:hypothetical protein